MFWVNQNRSVAYSGGCHKVWQSCCLWSWRCAVYTVWFFWHPVYDFHVFLFIILTSYVNDLDILLPMVVTSHLWFWRLVVYNSDVVFLWSWRHMMSYLSWLWCCVVYNSDVILCKTVTYFAYEFHVNVVNNSDLCKFVIVVLM